MKFFRVIMALCVLVSAQNGLFGLPPTRRGVTQTEQGMDKKALQAKQMKQKAIAELQRYINKTSTTRNKNDIANAEQALKLIKVAGNTDEYNPFSDDEIELFNRVTGALPADKARLEMGTQPKQQIVKYGEQELGSGQLPSLQQVLQKLSTKDLSVFYVDGKLNIDAVASAVRELRNAAPANTR